MQSLRPPNVTVGQIALAWCLAQVGVSTVIPGAKTAAQVDENVMAAGLTIEPVLFAELTAVYNQLVRPLVHHRW
jgi:aryl-alcohol dehydrogenase-like predicted oxidoreductase